MSETRFWLIRHAIVDENARAMLYGIMDVPLCETSLLEQAPMYQALAARLPRPALWRRGAYGRRLRELRNHAPAFRFAAERAKTPLIRGNRHTVLA
jgi:hypothetical protein